MKLGLLGRWVLLGALLALGAAVWKLTALEDFFSLDALRQLSARLSQTPFPIITVVAAFMLGSLVLFPITAMIVLSSLSLPPFQAIVAGVIGVGCSSCTGYGLGWLLGPERVERFLGPLYSAVRAKLKHNVFVSILLIRHLPLGPFTFVNTVLGSMHLPFGRFFLANCISLLPTILASALFGTGVQELLSRI